MIPHASILFVRDRSFWDRAAWMCVGVGIGMGAMGVGACWRWRLCLRLRVLLCVRVAAGVGDERGCHAGGWHTHRVKATLGRQGNPLPANGV